MEDKTAIIDQRPTTNDQRINALWNKKTSPLITITTAVRNGRSTIQRTINSIQSQTFRDIEYIIEDGSDELNGSDDIIEKFMNSTDIPVMFIRKLNDGGRHIGRNMMVKEARGKFLLGIDADDELTPEACEIFLKAWQSIPEEEKHKYREVVANCMDDKGNLIGTLFPEAPLSTNAEELRSKYHVKGEKVSIDLAAIRKANLFPEPEGVKFVSEGIVWARLGAKYQSYCINDMLRVYHTEGREQHNLSYWYSMTFQKCKDGIYNLSCMLNESEIYQWSFLRYLKNILWYCILENIVKKKEPEFVKRYPLKGIKNKFWKAVMFIPAKLGTPVYVRKYMR